MVRQTQTVRWLVDSVISQPADRCTQSRVDSIDRCPAWACTASMPVGAENRVTASDQRLRRRPTSTIMVRSPLGGLYEALGFAAVRDEAFRALVLGRIVEPTCKLDISNSPICTS